MQQGWWQGAGIDCGKENSKCQTSHHQPQLTSHEQLQFEMHLWDGCKQVMQGEWWLSLSPRPHHHSHSHLPHTRKQGIWASIESQLPHLRAWHSSKLAFVDSWAWRCTVAPAANSGTSISSNFCFIFNFTKK